MVQEHITRDPITSSLQSHHHHGCHQLSHHHQQGREPRDSVESSPVQSSPRQAIDTASEHGKAGGASAIFAQRPRGRTYDATTTTTTTTTKTTTITPPPSLIRTGRGANDRNGRGKRPPSHPLHPLPPPLPPGHPPGPPPVIMSPQCGNFEMNHLE